MQVHTKTRLATTDASYKQKNIWILELVTQVQGLHKYASK